jgi:hypothetical protein
MREAAYKREQTEYELMLNGVNEFTDEFSSSDKSLESEDLKESL